jgi:NAD(P)-dependent dehydrogenase (short-subunit alcohol dehydrogenase family)
MKASNLLLVMENKKYNLLQLENKVCVITGAASIRSIGYGTAELFAAHGAKLVILDLVMNNQIAHDLVNQIEIQTGKKVEIICLQCDVRSTEACEEAIQKVISHFGTIDCLVNCAGIVKSEGMLSITEQDYDLIMDVNLKGAFNICKSVLKVFTENNREFS